jgi:transcriptional regulator with XRE-family HTH domain
MDFTGAQCVSARTLLGWTRSKLSRVVGLNYNSIARFENDTPPRLSQASVRRISQCLIDVGLAPGALPDGILVRDPALLPLAPSQVSDARAALRLSLAEVARAAGIHPFDLANWESERIVLDDAVVARLREALMARGVEFRFEADGPKISLPPPQE